MRRAPVRLPAEVGLLEAALLRARARRAVLARLPQLVKLRVSHNSRASLSGPKKGSPEPVDPSGPSGPSKGRITHAEDRVFLQRLAVLGGPHLSRDTVADAREQAADLAHGALKVLCVLRRERQHGLAPHDQQDEVLECDLELVLPRLLLHRELLGKLDSPAARPVVDDEVAGPRVVIGSRPRPGLGGRRQLDGKRRVLGAFLALVAQSAQRLELGLERALSRLAQPRRRLEALRLIERNLRRTVVILRPRARVRVSPRPLPPLLRLPLRRPRPLLRQHLLRRLAPEDRLVIVVRRCRGAH